MPTSTFPTLTVSSACFRINPHRFNYPGPCKSRLQSPALSAIEWLHQTRVVEKGGHWTKVGLAPGPDRFIYASRTPRFFEWCQPCTGIQDSLESILETFHPCTLLQNPYSDQPGMDAWADLPPNWAGFCRQLPIVSISLHTSFGGLFSQTPLGDDPFVHPVRKQAGASYRRLADNQKESRS